MVLSRARESVHLRSAPCLALLQPRPALAPCQGSLTQCSSAEDFQSPALWLTPCARIQTPGSILTRVSQGILPPPHPAPPPPGTPAVREGPAFSVALGCEWGVLLWPCLLSCVHAALWKLSSIPTLVSANKCLLSPARCCPQTGVLFHQLGL